MEKRKDKRKKVRGDVSGKMILVEYLDILDLSLSGIRVNCNRRIDMNSFQKIQIEKDKIVIGLKGAVVRSIFKGMVKIGAKNLFLYEIAIKFKKLSDDEKSSLEKLIHLLGHG